MEWADYIEDAYISRKEVISGEAAIRCGLISMPLLSASGVFCHAHVSSHVTGIDRLRLACRLET
jgi:hypothetical protein